MTLESTCYMCDSSATSREHAPPLCFFPETNSIGRNLRCNLVTVPSCDLHNSRKSKDDEYLRYVILLVTAPNSSAAMHQFDEKLIPAVDRSGHVFRSLAEDRGPITEGMQVLQINRRRFDACVDHLARALFFDIYKRKWSLPMIVESPNFFSGISSDNVVPHQPTLDAVEVSRQFLGPEPIRGENQEVFKYRLRFDEENNCYAFEAIFYDCFEVYSFSSKQLRQQAAV